MIGGPISSSDNPNFRLKKSGIQKRYNHQIGSVMNFATANVQVCRSGINRFHGMCSCGSAGSLRICASSAALRRAWRSGRSYISHHAASHANPSAPVITNAHGHPNRTVIHGTVSGVTSAPTFVPALNNPVANARSRRGNHSATVLIAPGKLPDSPSPRANRAAMKPATDAE